MTTTAKAAPHRSHNTHQTSHPKNHRIEHRTKTQAAVAQLNELARELGPNARLPTMQQLCEMLGVSIVTLNRALSEMEGQGTIIRRHGVGIFVAAPAAHRTIGLVYDRDIFGAGTATFSGLLVERARTRADSSDEKFSLYLAAPSSTAPVHEDLVEALSAHRLNGILFVGEQNPEAARWLVRQNVPLVPLAYTSIAPHRVRIDHAASARLGAQALIDQGCRQIHLWIPHGVGIGPKRANLERERRAGRASTCPEIEAFHETLREHKLPIRAHQIWREDELSSEPNRQSPPAGEQGMTAALETFGPNASKNKAQKPDGIVILDDEMTRGALAVLPQLDVQIGANLQIASHLNKGSNVLLGHENQLTIMEIDPEQIVAAMFEMLETLMNGETPRQKIIVIQPQLRLAPASTI